MLELTFPIAADPKINDLQLDVMGLYKEAQQRYIPLIPNVKSYALIGSAMYVEFPNDVDILILVKSLEEAESSLYKVGFLPCINYDTQNLSWNAYRKGDLNFIVTKDKADFISYKKAMDVCHFLKLRSKEDRIAVCNIIRNQWYENNID